MKLLFCLALVLFLASCNKNPLGAGESAVDATYGPGIDAAPTISDISDQSTTEDTATPPISFTINDSDSDLACADSVTGTSSNTGLVANSAIVIAGTAPDCTVRLTPVTNANGTTTITLTLTDGTLTAQDTFVLSVGGVNNAPTISDITDQTTNEDTVTGAIAFTINDLDTTLTCAGSVSGTSSNTSVIASGAIVITGTAPNCTATLTPVANASGVSTITLTVTDGSLSAQDSFLLTVNAVNDAPVINPITDRVMTEDTPASVSFSVSDVDSTVTCAGSVSGVSSNAGVIADSGLVVSGTIPSCVFTVTPVSNASGSTTITVTASDGALSTSDNFNISVTATNDAPTISDVTNQTTNEDTATGAIAFTINDEDSTLTCAESVSGTSSNTSVVTNGAIVIAGIAPNCTATITPVTNAGGTTTITLTATDGALTSQDTFLLTVNAVNDVPTMSDVTNQSTNEDTVTGAIAFTIDDGDSTLTCAGSVSGTSSNTSVVTNGEIVIAGTAPNCTATITPVENGNGTSTITLTTTDGALTAQDTFVLTVNAVNDAPAISDVANQSTNEDTATGAIAFTINDVDSTITCGGSVSGASSNASVVTNGAIDIAGAALSCTATLTPVANANGTSTITLTATDGALTAQDTFVLTVSAVNDAPTISDVTNQSTNEDTATGAIAFTINDGDSTLTCAGSVSGASSNASVITSGAVVIAGTAPNCTATLTPVADASGTSTITLTATDGTLTAQDTFVLTVNAVNDAPTISAIAAQSMNEDVASSAIAFTINDVDNTLNCGTSVTKSSSVTSVIANSGIAIGGAALSCTVTLTPVINGNGSTTVTLTASDGTLTTNSAFAVTVRALPDLLSVTEPVNSTYGLGSSLVFEVAYDTNAVVLGTPRIVLTVGAATRYASYTSGNGSSVLLFTYTVGAGETDADGISANTTIDLNGGTILSSAGDSFPLDITSQLSSLTSVLVNTATTPPGQVAAVTQTNLDATCTQVSFTWTAPSAGSSAITEYRVQYRETGTSAFTTLSPSPASTSATVTGLTPNKNYEVKVAAYNGVVGPYSPLLSFTTNFTPASLNARIWYEAKDINGTGVVPADGTSISTLVDKSGRGNNAPLMAAETAGVIQTTSGQKVLRVSNATYFTNSSLGETNNNDTEVYLIAKANATGNTFAFCNENCVDTLKRYGTHFPWGGSIYIDLPLGNGVDTRFVTTWTGKGDTTNIIAWTFRSSTTQGRVLEKNGVSVASLGNRTAAYPLKKWAMFGDNTKANNWSADFVAIFVFDKVLTAGQRQLFFDYVETNYGVVMP